MARVLIIGYGNPLRGDDGFGPALAQRLLSELEINSDESQNDSDIEIIACHQLTLELAEPLSRTQRAIFVDANNGGTPGEISFREIEITLDALMQNALARFTHHLSPQTLLAYAQSLYGARPVEAFLLSVGGENFGYGETLSKTVADALERAHAQVLAYCAPH